MSPEYSPIFFPLAALHAVWNFPDQGSNLSPVQCKRRVLTTALPGNPQSTVFDGRCIGLRHVLDLWDSVLTNHVVPLILAFLIIRTGVQLVTGD